MHQCKKCGAVGSETDFKQNGKTECPYCKGKIVSPIEDYGKKTETGTA
jgi:DNA-directed RNA polymerase subunit RPC12/RpoP